MMVNLARLNSYIMLNFARPKDILKNDSCKTSHKWFILSAFLSAQHTITRKLSRSIVKIRRGKIQPTVYKFQASRLSHRGTYMQI